MFANGIFSIFGEWLDLDFNLQEDNADNFGGDKNPASSGDRQPPKNLKEGQYADEDVYLSRGIEDNTVWDLPWDENWHPSQFDGWGNPIAEAEHWQQQQGGNSCAVVAQELPPCQRFGIDYRS